MATRFTAAARIEEVQDVLREEALTVYREFAANRSVVYNARQGQ